MRVEEIAIGAPNVPLRRRAGAALEHELVAHELAVIFADGARRRLEARVGQVSASRPLPDIADHLRKAFAARGAHRPQTPRAEHAALERDACRRRLPLELGWEARGRPAGKRVRLVVADMGDWRRGIDRAIAVETHLRRAALRIFPIERRLPILAAHDVPAV